MFKIRKANTNPVLVLTPGIFGLFVYSIIYFQLFLFQLIARFVMDIFHWAPGMPGLFVAGLFSGALR